MHKSYTESLHRGFSYSLQLGLMMPLPLFKTTTYDKFYLASSFVESLIMGTILMSYCSMLLIAPEFILVDDRDIETFTGSAPDPITDFGIGIPCLYELRQGDCRTKYLRNTYDFISILPYVTLILCRTICTQGLLFVMWHRKVRLQSYHPISQVQIVWMIIFLCILVKLFSKLLALFSSTKKSTSSKRSKWRKNRRISIRSGIYFNGTLRLEWFSEFLMTSTNQVTSKH